MLSPGEHPTGQHAESTSPYSPSSPGSNVVILSAPTPVLVREAIHLHVLVWGHGRHPTKILWVWQPGRVTSPMYNLESSVATQYIFIEVRLGW